MRMIGISGTKALMGLALKLEGSASEAGLASAIFSP